MIEKNEESIETDEFKKTKIITNRRENLKTDVNKVKKEIQNCFAQLTEVLRTREKQLMRQVDALHAQQLSLIQCDINHLPSIRFNSIERHDYEEYLFGFGKVELTNLNGVIIQDREPYKIQEYQTPHEDHVSLDKPIKNILHRTGPHKDLDNSIINNSIDCYDQIPDENTSVTLDRNNLSILSSNEKLQIDNNITNELCNIEIKSLTIEENDHLPEEKDQSLDICSKLKLSDCDKIIMTKESLIGPIGLDISYYKHPIQIQQWLQQILRETETEPTVNEIGHFSEFSEARF